MRCYSEKYLLTEYIYVDIDLRGSKSKEQFLVHKDTPICIGQGQNKSPSK